jgi:hypothetical protein
MRLNRRTALGSCVALGLGLLVFSGCKADKATEVVPGFSTQVHVPRDMKSIRVDVRAAGLQTFCRSYQVYDGKVRLPRTLGLLPGESPGRPFTVQVAGFQVDANVEGGVSNCLDFKVSQKPGDARILRRSTQAYVPDLIKFLPMPMRYACYDVDCPDNQTCKAGQCVSDFVEATTLPDYREDYIVGRANTCFSVAQCLPGPFPLTQPPQVIDAASCIYAVPFTPSANDVGPKPANYPPPELLGSGLNVKVTYDGGYVSEVLDLDRDEGYFIPDPSKPQRFQLAPGLCALVKAPNAAGHRISSIEVSARCPSKTVLQPMCESEVPGSEVYDGGTDVSGDRSCLTRSALKPAKSALYVLIDQGTNMANAFFTQDRQKGAIIPALQAALNDPALENTFAAMKFLPTGNGAADCTGPSPFAALNGPDDVPFGKAFDVQATILQKIFARAANNALLRPESDPIHLGAAMRPEGAYQALGSQGANHEKILLILGNRGFDGVGDGCGGDPIARAQAAFTANRTRTYVVVRDSDKTRSPDPFAGAFAIAQAGGGKAFDSRPDEAAGLEAINTVVAQLGACLYDAPAEAIPTTAKLSYYDPLGQKQVEVPAATGACDATTPDTDPGGWKAEGSSVRICGQKCVDLRKVLIDLGKYNLGLLHQTSQAVPIHPVVCQ